MPKYLIQHGTLKIDGEFKKPGDVVTLEAAEAARIDQPGDDRRPRLLVSVDEAHADAEKKKAELDAQKKALEDAQKRADDEAQKKASHGHDAKKGGGK